MNNKITNPGSTSLPEKKHLFGNGYKLPFALGLISFTFLLAVSCKKPEMLNDAAGETATGKNAAGISSGNLWYDKFVSYESANGDLYIHDKRSDYLGWQESYLLRSYMTLYDVTKSTAWLDKFVRHTDSAINHTTSFGTDSYEDWVTKAYSTGQATNYPYMVHDGLMALPMARFIRLINQTPALQTAYSTKATTYRTFLEDEIIPKWSTSTSSMGNCWNSTSGYYRESTSFNSLPDAVFDPLPYNMMAPFAMALWTMYDVNASASYKTKADAMAQYLANGLSGNSAGYSWYYCNIASPHTEDVSHGNLDVEFAVEAFNRGIVFSGTHMQGFSNTLTDQMWNQDSVNPTITANVDGTGGVNASTTKQMYGWLQLTQFNAKAWTIAAEQYRNTSISGFSQLHTVAQLIAWDPVKIQNQGFELKSFSDATLPARWTRLGSPATAIVRSTAAADKVNGVAGIKIVSTLNDGIWQGAYQDWTGFTPGASYEVRFNVKATSGAGARVFMYNTTTSTVIGSTQNYTNTSWAAQSFTFTAPASGTARIYLENKDLSVAGTAYFDDVIIKKVGDAF